MNRPSNQWRENAKYHPGHFEMMDDGTLTFGDYTVCNVMDLMDEVERLREKNGLMRTAIKKIVAEDYHNGHIAAMICAKVLDELGRDE